MKNTTPTTDTHTEQFPAVRDGSALTDASGTDSITSRRVPKIRRSKRTPLGTLVSESLILPFLSRIALFLANGIRESAIGHFFTGYDRDEEKRKASLHTLPADRLRLSARFLRPLRFRIAAQFDNSAILSLLSRLGAHLAGLPLYIYGFSCLFFSLFSSGVFAFRYLTRTIGDETYGNLAVSVIFLVIGIILIISRRHLSEALCQKGFVGFLLFRMLGVQDSWFRALPPSHGRLLPAGLIGAALGILTLKIPPEYLFFGILLLLALVLFYKIPEAGVVSGIFLLPFAILIIPHPSILLAGYTIYLVFCFFLKYLRGKRVIRFEWIDLCVFLFMLVMLAGGLFSASPADSVKPAAIYVCFMFWYFLIVNLIRSDIWIKRCITSLLCSASLTALYGVYQYLFTKTATIWQDTGMFSDISGRVVSTFENPNILAEYLILCIPIALAKLMTARTSSSRFLYLFVSMSLGACLVFTWSRGAWLGLLLALLLFFLIYSSKTFIAVLLGLFAVPFLPIVMPDSVVRRFLSIGNLADSSTSYRVHIWQGVMRMLRDYSGAGIGIGCDVFQKIYPLYSLSGIESAPHSHNLFLQITVETGIPGLLIFLILLVTYAKYGFTRLSKPMHPDYRLLLSGLFCGVAAVLMQGMTDYIWYNYRVFLMFWISFALTVAVGRIAGQKAEPGQYADDFS